MEQIKIGRLIIGFSDREDGNQRLEENRKINIPLYIPNQKHTSIVLRDYDDISKEADGLYTTKKHIALGVLTADCLPVVIYNQTEFAVVHSGWRGLFGGILENAISCFKNKPEGAFIGPSIRSCCYEVGEDFIEKLSIPKEFYFIKGGRYFLSLQDVAIEKLIGSGIKDIDTTPHCSGCSGRYFSYRKGDFDDRILTYAYLI